MLKIYFGNDPGPSMRQLVNLLCVWLVAVSCKCTTAECAQDGATEEFCGSCDFEHHSCGWNNTGDVLYSWIRQRANSSFVPGYDHTTGSPWGYVMQIDVQKGAIMFPRAILEFPVNKVMGLGCSFSFWYHINDQNTHALSDLEVKMVRGSTEKVLMTISERNTTGWENATVFIGNQPKGYKLQFVSMRPFMGHSDMMLDDFSFDNCAEGDIPPGSDQLSCDFEKDTCSWFKDFTACLLWDRRKDEFGDNTEVTGYHMVVKADNKVNISSTARLVSVPQTAQTGLCVSFWYHIFGNSIGSLKFITKHPGEEETVVWMRSGTQGNKWRFADLTFHSDKPIQFIIEAEVGGTQGSISIDDVVVSSSTDGFCPPERECTFQGSLCGLQPFGDPGWSRVRGSQLPADATGPKTDHTLGTDQGYYLSSQLWSHSPGSKIMIKTAEMEPTAHNGECLMFWFHMEGVDTAELNVYIQTSDSQTELNQVWTRSSDQGLHWRHGRVTLYSPQQSYKVVFEAVVGVESRGDIAIDDLIVLNDACPPQGFCDFEKDFCGWVNSPPSKSGLGLDWDWLSGSSSNSFLPSRDHTLNSRLGHFAFFANTKPNETARLESETMASVEKACLELWHYSSDWLVGHPSIMILSVFLNETGSLRPLWSTNGFLNQTWILNRVDYSSLGPHQILLEATCLKPECGSMSLDDVHIIRDSSCSDLIPTTPAPPPITTAPASATDCTFEQGLCSWVGEGSADLTWTLSNGLSVDHQWDGPLYDHTLENYEGVFLLLNGSGSKEVETASISAPVLDISSEFCVEFWFYMLGPSVPSLDLLIHTETSELLVWTREGSQDREWIKAEVNISNSAIKKLKITAHKEMDSIGFIAIDDITVKQGTCHNQDVCGFDSDWCGFENDVSHLGHWSRTKATKPHLDHTYRTEQGFYMSVMLSNSAKTEIAQLLSHELPAASEMCVRFWYWLPAESTYTLAVHLFWSGEMHEKLWESSITASTNWEVAEITVWAPAKFHVVFKAWDVPGMTSTVKLDDVSVKMGACRPRGSCDFESGQCTWVNRLQDGGHDWVLTSGGLPTDHTIQTSEGVFLMSSSQHLSHISNAQIVSEWIQQQDTSSCLSFWSYMGTSDSGTLQLQILSEPTEEELKFNIDKSVNKWTKFSQSVKMKTKPFQVLIEAETNPNGFIAIDDISITPGICPVNESSSGFVGCSFENGACGWDDISSGQFVWAQGRNGSEDGPSVDNTLGNELGWYMAVKDNGGDPRSPAVLLSPIMKPAYVTCTLHFYFNMNGQDLGNLSVLLQGDSGATVLWWMSGNHGDKWHQAEVPIGRVPHNFRVRFESRSKSNPGHIAIDDIEFTNCSPPAPQPQCPDTMFRCNNRACVDLNRVCDFSDDCGDGSDEVNCEKHGVVERCSFENGMCFWTNSIWDKPETKWTRHTGHEAWPNTGPPRDHSKNSAAGHFISPGIKMNGEDHMSQILSRTLLPSVNCKVRFFYYSLSDTEAELTVRSRTQIFGEDDIILWIRQNSHSYSWQRAELTFSSSTKSKVLFAYQQGKGSEGLVAVDDISFSGECLLDPLNSDLPRNTSTTSAPPTSSPVNQTTTSVNPCQKDEFFCWLSAGEVCVKTNAKCDYHRDCPQGEDEHECGPCTFESDQCGWTDVSRKNKWRRQKASNTTVPSTDHTTQTGYYMKVNFSDHLKQSEAHLQSPPLPASSPFCQLQFHFHISEEVSGSLSVLMQQEAGSEGSVAILWSRSHRTVNQWTPENLMLGQMQKTYKVWFSSINNGSTLNRDFVIAVDDISFINCEKSFQPPGLSSVGCSFEEGLCDWLQGAEDELEWTIGSGSTETPNTGPNGDHTTGKGKYLYLKTSSPSQKQNMAQLKSTVLPSAGEQGYCFTFWYHMFGPTVGSLRMFIQTTDPFKKTLVWQKSGNQGNQWLPMRSHVTSNKIHRVILEATVGGEAGDIAIDDISLTAGPCPVSDLCDFEDNSCNWEQEILDDFDWIRQTGSSQNPGPDTDHTTNTATGHYYYLPSTPDDSTGQNAKMSSPLYPAGMGSCVQLWYHMFGEDIGTLNVYQRSEDGQRGVMLFSQTGDQGPLWRSAQATLLHRKQPYKIVVEGVMAGPSQWGGIAFDDVHLTESACSPPGHCDFETNMCGLSNLGQVDQGDWLRGSGASPNPNTGPQADHTTNSSKGYYVYVDSAVGQWGDQSFLISEVLQPSTRGHCITFWYHMFGDHVGTLKLYINDRKSHDAGNSERFLKWIETGDKGDQWQEASVSIKHTEPFWFVFVYQRGRNVGGDVALDDITVVPFPCYAEPPVEPSDGNHSMLSVGLGVGLTVLVGIVVAVVLFKLNRKRCTKNDETMNTELIDQTSTLDLFECGINGSQSFDNTLYDPSPQASSDA